MELNVHIVGTAPLIMHNGQLADPKNYYSQEKKKITAKRKKVEADNEEVSRLEFIGSLYLNHEGKVCMPAKVLQGALVAGAKGLKDGKSAKAGVFVNEDTEFLYDGSTDPKELYAASDFVSREVVKQGQVRIVRVRPIFKKWEAKFKVSFLEDITTADNIKGMIEHAGRFCGLGDWRPQHGRFSVANIKEIKD